MIELHITYTGKSYSPKDSWRILNVDREVAFNNIDEVKNFLRNRYGKCKRVPMYRDGNDGKAIQTGWIFGYRNADWSHYPVQKWLSQDWCEVRESKPLNVKN